MPARNPKPALESGTVADFQYATLSYSRTEHGGLDILVNNAGIVDAQDGPPTVASSEAAHRILDTNFVGTLAVTQAMLLRRKRSRLRKIS
jgi:NAD(P)-dependent dehydrogenase (short-subunit alcohol dehydrogenase family)